MLQTKVSRFSHPLKKCSSSVLGIDLGIDPVVHYPSLDNLSVRTDWISCTETSSVFKNLFSKFPLRHIGGPYIYMPWPETCRSAAPDNAHRVEYVARLVKHGDLCLISAWYHKPVHVWPTSSPVRINVQAMWPKNMHNCGDLVKTQDPHKPQTYCFSWRKQPIRTKDWTLTAYKMYGTIGLQLVWEATHRCA